MKYEASRHARKRGSEEPSVLRTVGFIFWVRFGSPECFYVGALDIFRVPLYIHSAIFPTCSVFQEVNLYSCIWGLSFPLTLTKEKHLQEIRGLEENNVADTICVLRYLFCQDGTLIVQELQVVSN